MLSERPPVTKWGWRLEPAEIMEPWNSGLTCSVRLNACPTRPAPPPKQPGPGLVALQRAATRQLARSQFTAISPISPRINVSRDPRWVFQPPCQARRRPSWAADAVWPGALFNARGPGDECLDSALSRRRGRVSGQPPRYRCETDARRASRYASTPRVGRPLAASHASACSQSRSASRATP